MRLRKIKLSGFKSFVDPTTLNIPGNLVGIVGPNGCGKSNIIDAVTWVMGESSAKHLRGDALTDVIFNGSSARNPVGQAAVELLFDNTEFKIGGQYASYDEISVKRQINRDGISSYFLNGTRCRRRDITAIFLGTGLGPRSYAIIEQGMISRLIESKPEELRQYIEEAAGISKYRERRRETENRIRNTKENISRLNDIREELGKQLGHLKRQTRAAERYQTLKNEQRTLESELLAIKWKKLSTNADKQKEETRKHETRVEATAAEIRRIERDIEESRDKLTTANDGFNKAQSVFYQIGGDISQLEQKIQHTQDRINTCNQDLAQLETETLHTQSQKKEDMDKLVELANKAGRLEPELNGSRGKSDNAYSLLNQAEQAMQEWQSEWDKFNETMADYIKRDEIGKTRIDHLEFSIDESRQKIDTLQKELAEIDKEVIEGEKVASLESLNELGKEQKRLNTSLESKNSELGAEKNNLNRLTEKLNEARMQQHNLEGRLDSLKTLQNSSFLQDDIVVDWLEQKGLSAELCLAKQIEVETEWAHAVEMVLDSHLQDICVDDINDFESSISGLKQVQLGLVCPQAFQANSGRSNMITLADKVKSDFPVRNMLANVYIADDAASALKLRSSLEQHESVITRDGFWAGPCWIKLSRSMEIQDGLLSREQEILVLMDKLEKATGGISELSGQVEKSKVKISGLEKAINELREQLQLKQETISEYRANLAAINTRLNQSGIRSEHIETEIDLLQDQLTEDRAELERLEIELEDIGQNRDELEQQRAELTRLRDKYRASLEQARESWTQTHELSHGIALQLEAISSQKASLEQSIKRSELQATHLNSRRDSINRNLAESETVLKELQGALEQKLTIKIDAEKKLSEARTRVQQIENSIRTKEQDRSLSEQNLQSQRDELEKLRLTVNEIQVRLQTIEEQFKSRGADLANTLEGMDEEAEQEAWEEKLESVSRSIHRLGPINLAAIEEFNQLSERKTYLDSQHDDLEKALSTLENAIQKIDKESRSRFRDTFDQLNANLQETFPQLFGGGRASLELTGSDLLETGVTIMARPPGKRNSTIHLLSGGEKALTAVALVFSIFKLNPAPFCILDEVDAPLDDANVGRYSEMVSNMSSDVQFIFVTHNKITMEIAHQLLGVTMYEAGVSRLVSVDVDEAVEMAATA